MDPAPADGAGEAEVSDDAPIQQLKAEDSVGFYMALGYLGHMWAMIEQNFDMWIAITYHSLNGRALVNSELPVSFRFKSKFLWDAFRKVPELQPFAPEAKPLIKAARRISKKRNDLMHGVLTSMTPVDGKWKMVVFDYEKDANSIHWHRLRAFDFSPEEFAAFEAKITPLATKVTALGIRLSGIARMPDHGVFAKT
jgi:hypothetical protein